MRRLLYLLLILLFGIPAISWVVWQLWPARPLSILILDKTSTTAEGTEHRSFNWVLTYNKYTKPGGGTYWTDKDYYGFFPLQNEKYLLKGLEQCTALQVDSLADRSDMAYFTDTYGVYRGDWYQRTRALDRSLLLYGGLQKNDLRFLEAMKSQGKLIITEFNFLASPTSDSLRRAAERMFEIRWTGWTGRCYSSLDSMNSDIPRWALRLYERQQHERWCFRNPGIILIHSSDTIVVLEEATHLEGAVPTIMTQGDPRDVFHVPDEMPYPYWFDITLSGPSNTVAAEYSLHTNMMGDSVLNRYRIPRVFPAVIERRQRYTFYYFAGDFADNPIFSTSWAHFKGLPWLRASFYDKEDPDERLCFFWEYYFPMMTAILERYEHDMQTRARYP